jgi:tetratricopeptide (TPR) repeat protein
MSWFTKLRGWWSGRPRALVLAVALVLVGAGAYPAVRHWRAWQELRAGRTAAARGHYEEARGHLDRCLEIWPRSAEAHFLAARATRRCGDLEAAEDHLRAAQRLGWFPEALALEWVLLRAHQGDPSAVDALEALVAEGHPDSEQCLAALAGYYLKSYDLGKALACLNRWLEQSPGNAQALAWRGEAHERMHHLDKAAADYRSALAAVPDDDASRLRLARLLLDRRDRPQEAVEHFEHLWQRRGDSEVVVGLARCRAALGRPDEARQLLDELLASGRGGAPARGERGKLALRAGDLAGAQRWLGAALRAPPYEPDLVYHYCLCLERAGRKEEATRWCGRLARIEAELRRLKQTHLEILKTPGDPALRCEAGRIMLRNGQDAEGLRWLLSALRCDRQHVPTHAALAGYYRQHGDAARAAWHGRMAERSGARAPSGVEGDPP